MHFALGEKDRAFALLDRAVAERDALVAGFAKDPMYDPMRSDPRFEAFARHVAY
jgi:hypothetical protein